MLTSGGASFLWRDASPHRGVGREGVAVVNTREIETAIIRALCQGLIDEGYTLSVHDRQDEVVSDSQDVDALLNAMFSVDEEFIIVRQAGKYTGNLMLVHGNGQDVLADWSARLDDVVSAVLDQLERDGVVEP